MFLTGIHILCLGFGFGILDLWFWNLQSFRMSIEPLSSPWEGQGQATLAYSRSLTATLIKAACSGAHEGALCTLSAPVPGGHGGDPGWTWNSPECLITGTPLPSSWLLCLPTAAKPSISKLGVCGQPKIFLMPLIQPPLRH